MSKEQLTRLENKIDKLDDRLDGVEKILVLQEANLKLHMKRSDQLETLILKKEEDLNLRIEPVATHVENFKSLMRVSAWVVGATGAVVSIIYTIVQIINA